jgi:hypothetical protein
MFDESIIVIGMILLPLSILYAIVSGLRRGPKFPAVILLVAVGVFIVLGVIHDESKSRSIRQIMAFSLMIFVPLAVGAYAHALRSRGGL